MIAGTVKDKSGDKWDPRRGRAGSPAEHLGWGAIRAGVLMSSHSKMAIIGIVAVDRNLAIGKEGRLPWHYSADMKFFKQTTIGNTVVMGRRTWLTLPGPLKDRQNIVLSRDPNLQSQDSLIVLSGVDSVLDLIRTQEDHLFVIGGAQVYESFLPHIQRWIVTEVPLAVEGADTFMPANFLDGFELYELRQLDEGLRVKFYEREST